jgi:hypothetical protein
MIVPVKANGGWSEGGEHVSRPMSKPLVGRKNPPICFSKRSQQSGVYSNDSLDIGSTR